VVEVVFGLLWKEFDAPGHPIALSASRRKKSSTRSGPKAQLRLHQNRNFVALVKKPAIPSWLVQIKLSCLAAFKV